MLEGIRSGGLRASLQRLSSTRSAAALPEAEEGAARERFEASDQVTQAESPTSRSYRPILDTVKISAERARTPVSREVLERAQQLLDRGDRGGAYLELYRELGNEQILIQTQITTYTGLWGSGALQGNHLAQQEGGSRYNLDLDQFSKEIAQATLDAIRADLDRGGTGRLSDDQFQSADRKVWTDKGMPELFPGNVQFFDLWDHPEDRGAFFSRSSWNMVGVGARWMFPDPVRFGLKEDHRSISYRVGKRPAEFVGNPDYTLYGGEKDRFVTVIDNRTGFVEAFWDNRPRVGPMRVPQIPNRPLEPGSREARLRQKFYQDLGANQHGSAQMGSEELYGTSP